MWLWHDWLHAPATEGSLISLLLFRGSYGSVAFQQVDINGHDFSVAE